MFVATLNYNVLTCRYFHVAVPKNGLGLETKSCDCSAFFINFLNSARQRGTLNSDGDGGGGGGDGDGGGDGHGDGNDEVDADDRFDASMFTW